MGVAIAGARGRVGAVASDAALAGTGNLSAAWAQRGKAEAAAQKIVCANAPALLPHTRYSPYSNKPANPALALVTVDYRGIGRGVWRNPFFACICPRPCRIISARHGANCLAGCKCMQSKPHWVPSARPASFQAVLFPWRAMARFRSIAPARFRLAGRLAWLARWRAKVCWLALGWLYLSLFRRLLRFGFRLFYRRGDRI